MRLNYIHLTSLVLTLAVVAVISLYAARKVKSAADFDVGGRAAGVPLVAGTIVGTMVGGSATIGTAQLAFTVGLSAWWFTLGAGIALLILGLFYAKPLRASCLQTIPQYLVANYGTNAGPLCSITSSIGIFFSMIANVLSTVPLIAAVFRLNVLQAAGLALVLIVFYVFFGGVWGTGLVGLFKSFIIYVTLISVAVVTYLGLGGFNGLVNSFPPFPWFSLFGRGLWIDIGSGLSLIVGTLSTQTYIQAVYSAKDVKAARLGAVTAALVTLPIGLAGVMAGMFMRVYHPDIQPIDALPLFILNYLPPWIGGVAIAALLLAAIGSAAGLALGVGTMLSRDIIGKLLKNPSDKLMLIISRMTVLLITFASVVVAYNNMKSLVLEWNYLSMGLRGAGTFLPLTAAVFLPGRIKGYWAMWSMAAGAGTALVWKFMMPRGLDPLYAGLAVGAVFLVIGCFRQKEQAIVCEQKI